MPPTTKDRFTALDTLAVVRELRGLIGSRVDKAFDRPAGGWTLVLHPIREERRELVLAPGRYVALLAPPVAHAEELSPFARELRRWLGGAVLREVAEPAGERYLEMRFGRGDEPDGFVLAVELFGTGNVVVARGARLVAVARPRTWAHRSVRVGADYQRPPERPDPWRLGLAAIEAELARSRTDLATTLAARLGLGGPVSEEILARSGWDPAQPASSADLRKVASELRGVLEGLVTEIGDRPTGRLYRAGGELVDATPYASRRWPDAGPEEVLPTFSEAAERYFGALVAPEPSAEELSARKEREALRRLAERQRQAIEELAASAERLRADADALLSHYAQAERTLAEAPAGRPEVAIELGDRTVTVPVGLNPRRAAQTLYDRAKALGEKLAGARTALAATEERLAAPPAPAVRPSGARPPARLRRHWFERYRWFISSEGVVVIGGRDAASNDLLVRRHLKSGDLYVHADIQGASSVVVKRPEDGRPIGEATLREAAQWAAAFSKAWRAGLAAGSAFWVTPDQVSKAAAAGEFVARGAFVIHGTKNFVRDVPLEIALGPITYAGEERWTAAPETAVRALGRVRALLTPGDDRARDRVEAELARDLGVSRTLLQGLLPAGGLTVRRA